jgi:hypothetical protein
MRCVHTDIQHSLIRCVRAVDLIQRYRFVMHDALAMPAAIDSPSLVGHSIGLHHGGAHAYLRLALGLCAVGAPHMHTRTTRTQSCNVRAHEKHATSCVSEGRRAEDGPFQLLVVVEHAHAECPPCYVRVMIEVVDMEGDMSAHVRV